MLGSSEVEQRPVKAMVGGSNPPPWQYDRDMGTAPYSAVRTPPSPSTTGGTLAVREDDGRKFPDPPFTALVWTTDVLPSATTSEELEVYDVTGDVFSFDRRSGSSISIEAGMPIGVKTAIPTILLGASIRLSIPGTDDEPYELRTTDPGGSLGAFAGQAGVDEEGDPVTYYEFESFETGMHEYRWIKGSGPAQSGRFFVEHTDAW